MPSPVLCFGFNTSFQRQIVQTWNTTVNADIIKAVLLSSKSCPHVQEHTEIAFQSVRHLPNYAAGKRLKLEFLKLQYNWIYHLLAKREPRQVQIYNGLNGVNHLVSAACRELDLSTLYFERAPLQHSLQIDPVGVNFRSSVPRNTDFYGRVSTMLAERGLHEEDLQPMTLDDYGDRYRINVDNNSTLQQSNAHALQDLSYLFCPLQVPRDTQLTVFGGWIESISHLLDCLNKASRHLPPGMHIRIKEHPKSRISFADSVAHYNNSRLVLDHQHNVYDLLNHSSGVVTINSSVGLEAFLFKKCVITLGDALYSFGNLTLRASNLDDLCEAMNAIEVHQWSQEGRENLLRFLNFWFPRTEQVLAGKYTPDDLKIRDQRFQTLLERT